MGNVYAKAAAAATEKEKRCAGYLALPELRGTGKVKRNIVISQYRKWTIYQPVNFLIAVQSINQPPG